MIRDRWNDRLTHEMARKQNQRSNQVGGHSYISQIERYGLGIMFAELANIMSRLELMLWVNEPDNADPDRLLDLLVDLGNYTSFTYEYVYMSAVTKEEKDDDTSSYSSVGEDPGRL